MVALGARSMGYSMHCDPLQGVIVFVLRRRSQGAQWLKRSNIGTLEPWNLSHSCETYKGTRARVIAIVVPRLRAMHEPCQLKRMHEPCQLARFA
jgi:hypothetical protein